MEAEFASCFDGCVLASREDQAAAAAATAAARRGGSTSGGAEQGEMRSEQSRSVHFVGTGGGEGAGASPALAHALRCIEGTEQPRSFSPPPPHIPQR